MSAGFCIQCAQACHSLVPEGDNRARKVCTQCGHIHYENPKNVVGCLLEWQGKVLLCKRAIEPRYGYWTLPAGFMENEESTMQGAAREAFEEATAQCDDLRLFALYNLPRISQVYLMYHGVLRDGFAQANEETLEVGLFSESDIPWQELAFPVVTETLERYFEQSANRSLSESQAADQKHRVLVADIHSAPGMPLDIIRHDG